MARSVHVVEGSDEAERMAKHDKFRKNIVKFSIGLCAIIFAVDYGLEYGSSVNQLNRTVSMLTFAVVGVIFFVFSYRLLRQIKTNLHGELADKNSTRVSENQRRSYAPSILNCL